MYIYISVSVFLYSYVCLSIFFSFLSHFFVFNLLSCCCCFWFLLVSLCFPFPLLLVSFSFVVSILHLFLLFFLHLLLPFLSFSSSSLCLHFLCSSSSCLVSCPPCFSLLLLFLSSLRLPLLPPPPFPSSVPLLPSSVFSCFSSLSLFSPLFVFYCFLLCLFFSSSSFLSSSYSTVFSFVSSSLPSSSVFFASFFSSAIASFFLSFWCHFIAFFLAYLFILLHSLFLCSSLSSFGFLFPLSVISCSFFHFPFACFTVLELGNLAFRFFLSLLLSLFVRSVIRFPFSRLFSLPVSPPLLFQCSLYLFRQNTYLQNKKHTLTCQGGTGCYRFNYQPGS